VDRPLESVTHGQCDARPTVTFTAAERHRSMFQILLLSEQRRTYVNTLTRVVTGSAPAESRTSDLAIASPTCYRYISKPHRSTTSGHLNFFLSYRVCLLKTPDGSTITQCKHKTSTQYGKKAFKMLKTLRN